MSALPQSTEEPAALASSGNFSKIVKQRSVIGVFNGSGDGVKMGVDVGGDVNDGGITDSVLGGLVDVSTGNGLGLLQLTIITAQRIRQAISLFLFIHCFCIIVISPALNYRDLEWRPTRCSAKNIVKSPCAGCYTDSLCITTYRVYARMSQKTIFLSSNIASHYPSINLPKPDIHFFHCRIWGI